MGLAMCQEQGCLKQGCDGGCVRVGINTVPGSSALSSASEVPLLSEGRQRASTHPVKMVKTVGQTEAMSYKQQWKEQR